MVACTGEDIFVGQGHTVFCLRMSGNLVDEPVADIIGEVVGVHAAFRGALFTPPVLERIDEEQHIAINETIGDALELRFHRSSVRKSPVGIEMVVVVETRAVVVVSVGRHECHLVQCRTHGAVEPLLPLPLRVGLATGIRKVTREETELRIGLILSYRFGAFVGLLDVLIVLDMTIAHIDEGEIALVGILGDELCNLTPVLTITDTPAIYRTRLQRRSLCLMTYIIELRITRQTCSRTDIVFRTLRSLDRRVVEVRIGRLCIYLDHTCSGEVLGRSIRFGYQLYFTVCDTAVGEPAEAHMGSRVAVDSSDLVIRHLLGLQRVDSGIHSLQIAGNLCDIRIIFGFQTVYLSRLFGYEELDHRRYRIIAHQVGCLCFQYLMRIELRRNRLHNDYSKVLETAVLRDHTGNRGVFQ